MRSASSRSSSSSSSSRRSSTRGTGGSRVNSRGGFQALRGVKGRGVRSGFYQVHSFLLKGTGSFPLCYLSSPCFCSGKTEGPFSSEPKTADDFSIIVFFFSPVIGEGDQNGLQKSCRIFMLVNNIHPPPVPQ